MRCVTQAAAHGPFGDVARAHAASRGIAGVPGVVRGTTTDPRSSDQNSDQSQREDDGADYQGDPEDVA